MLIITEDDTAYIQMDAPATTEADRRELDFSNRPEIRRIRIQFRGVKMITSMVLAAMMFLMDRHRKTCEIRLLNLEPELRSLLSRTGLGSWLELAESAEE
ncbi:MAG: hypothetical protein NXI24_14095 [bacterium]|nr:hypothetical protein [bacterium]